MLGHYPKPQILPNQRATTSRQAPSRPKVIVGSEIVDQTTLQTHGFIKTYSVGHLLGTGAFAKCYELVSKDSKARYAGKLVPRSSLNTVIKKKLISEIRIHRSLNHRHIVKFHRWFEDENNLILLLELCPQHSLMELWQKRKGRFTETEAQYFLWQLVDAVHFMHSNNVIHRDLKLGNILLDSNMQIKVGDFGLATRLKNQTDRRRTMCGTPNYIAPEILTNSSLGHSFEVDVWAIGVIAYILLFGNPPFETKDIKVTYQRITNKVYSFPEGSHVSQAGRDLVASIFQEPEHRPTLQQLRQHKFFSQSPFPCHLSSDIWHTPLEFTHYCISGRSSSDVKSLPFEAQDITELPVQPTLTPSSSQSSMDSTQSSGQGNGYHQQQSTSHSSDASAAASAKAAPSSSAMRSYPSSAQASALSHHIPTHSHPQKPSTQLSTTAASRIPRPVDSRMLNKEYHTPQPYSSIKGNIKENIKEKAMAPTQATGLSAASSFHHQQQQQQQQQQQPHRLQRTDSSKQTSGDQYSLKPSDTITNITDSLNRCQISEDSTPTAQQPEAAAASSQQRYHRQQQSSYDHSSQQTSTVSRSQQQQQPHTPPPLSRQPSTQQTCSTPTTTSSSDASQGAKSSRLYGSSPNTYLTKLKPSASQDQRGLQVHHKQSTHSQQQQQQQQQQHAPYTFESRIWANLWVDINSKFGVGYILSNGIFGVCFNDFTIMVLHPDGVNVQYISSPPSSSSSSKSSGVEIQHFIRNEHPPELSKKAQLFKHFYIYLEEFERKHRLEQSGKGTAAAATHNTKGLVAGGIPSLSTQKAIPFPGNENYLDYCPPFDLSTATTVPMPHISSFNASSSALALRFNNKSTQILFHSDSSELYVDSSAGLVTYTNAASVRSTCSIADINTITDQKMLRRIHFVQRTFPKVLVQIPQQPSLPVGRSGE